MTSILVIGAAACIALYLAMMALLQTTQDQREPPLPPTSIPFLDFALGVAKHKVNYLVNLKFAPIHLPTLSRQTDTPLPRSRYRFPIHTLRIPFQRFYVIGMPHLIQALEKRINALTFVPTLLDFGMLFSGLNKESQEVLRKAFDCKGNGFTMSVHKYLLSGSFLRVATRAAIDKLSVSVPISFNESRSIGLFETLRHDLTLALTGAVYGPGNPYDDPEIEASWREFVPGISHLLYSPFPCITARKALRARDRVIESFKQYFETDSHWQAFPMIAEMYEINRGHGLSSDEAAKMEMATSLAMLSSGAITAFWLMLHILSDPVALGECRQELLSLIIEQTQTVCGQVNVVDVSMIKEKCPTLMAMLHETFRYHSTVINIKKVQHDTIFLQDQYLLKKGSIIMIPGASVHHDTDIWGPAATSFSRHRFLDTDGRKKLSSTSAFRPFGSGATMCPGRHFSTNAILSLVAMVLLQFDIAPKKGEWIMPTKKHADMWNAMPKPDNDVQITICPRRDAEGVQWKFLWGSGEED